MKKQIIYGFGKDGEYSYIIVAKDKNFFNWLSVLLFESFQFRDVSKVEYENSKGTWVAKNKNIRHFTDKHESYYSLNPNVKVDIFYGSQRVFINVIAPNKIREKYFNVLDKYSKWKKATHEEPPF